MIGVCVSKLPGPCQHAGLAFRIRTPELAGALFNSSGTWLAVNALCMHLTIDRCIRTPSFEVKEVVKAKCMSAQHAAGLELAESPKCNLPFAVQFCYGLSLTEPTWRGVDSLRLVAQEVWAWP